VRKEKGGENKGREQGGKKKEMMSPGGGPRGGKKTTRAKPEAEGGGQGKLPVRREEGKRCQSYGGKE